MMNIPPADKSPVCSAFHRCTSLQKNGSSDNNNLTSPLQWRTCRMVQYEQECSVLGAENMASMWDGREREQEDEEQCRSKRWVGSCSTCTKGVVRSGHFREALSGQNESTNLYVRTKTYQEVLACILLSVLRACTEMGEFRLASGEPRLLSPFRYKP